MRNIYVFPILAVLLTGLALTAREQRASAQPGQGTDWLRWNLDIKKLLVEEYTLGYIDGSMHTCELMSDQLGTGKKYRRIEETPYHRCFEAIRNFPRPAEHYVEKLDGFYKAYPEHAQIPARFILRRLYEGNDLSLQQIHELARSGALRVSQ